MRKLTTVYPILPHEVNLNHIVLTFRLFSIVYTKHEEIFMMDNKDKLIFIKNIKLMKDIPEPYLVKVASCFEEKKFWKGQAIIAGGDAADNNLYVIVSGQVNISINAPVPVDLLDLKPGHHFGEFSLIDGFGRSANAIAETDTRVLCISKDNFDNLCKDNFELGYFLVRNIARRLCYFLRKGDKAVQSWFSENF